MRIVCGIPTSLARGVGPKPMDTASRGYIEKRALEHSDRPYLRDASAKRESNLLWAGGEVGINLGLSPARSARMLQVLVLLEIFLHNYVIYNYILVRLPNNMKTLPVACASI